MLSFDLVHVFKTMQMMSDGKKISRSLMMQELGLGEGSIKTLVKHLKMQGLVENSNAGMWLTSKGETLYAKLYILIPKEMDIAKCSVALGKFNHAVLLKDMASNIKSGIEQRDAAIKAGAVGATTLLCKNDRLVLPGTGEDLMRNDQKIHLLIMEKLSPKQNDVIIIGSSQNKKIAEMAAKSAALYTIEDL
jgi:predicted methyltransferase